MKSLNLRIDKKIAILEFDQPESKVNVLNTNSMQELSDALDEIANKPKSEIEALIITSKKDGIFIAGADIKEIENITLPKDAIDKAEKGKQVFDKLERLDLITLAVINGACLGGGLELALACKYRTAGFSDRVKIGLPEVMLGIIPGWGGTQRLPRVVGLVTGLDMILGAKVVSSKDALKYSLVDRLFPDSRLEIESIDFIRDILSRKVSAARKKKKKLLQRFLEDSPLGRMVVFSQAKTALLRKTKGFYPAPLKVLEVIKKTYGSPGRKGFILESDAFGELAVTGISKNLIKVFYLNEEFKKFSWVDSRIKPLEINKCGIVGAGIMGGGIAQLLASRDVPSRLKDINYDQIKHALKTASSIFKYALRKRKLKPYQVEYKLGLISPTLTYRGFENTDLVIEAIVEDLDIKKNVFKELSGVTSLSTVLASNTSSLPIIEMARSTTSPDKVVGLHFFNPVHLMPLVEVIKSDMTSDETLATAITFARKIGKVVIVVKDVPGFLINRILLPYLNEAGFLIEEGMTIERIDKLACQFGMPMGPLELIDEVGIDVGYKVAKVLEHGYGARMKVAAILEEVKQRGFLGKKSGAGFYLHRGERKIPNADIYKFIGPSARRPVSGEIALKRMMYIMINEAARCLEENVVDRPEVVDVGMIMGTGFPPFRGGLLRYADSAGIDNIVKDLQYFEKEFDGIRFKPCTNLLDMLEKRRGFYGTF